MAHSPDNLQHLSDEELLPLFHVPDRAEQAFAVLIDRYSRPLYVVIRRIVLNHDDADDVLQETYMKIWHNITNFRNDSKLLTWMYSIATNEALSHLRREKHTLSIPLTTDEYDLSETLIADPYFDGEKVEAQLLAAIDQLPEKQKLTFQLRYFEEMPYSEIAQIMGVTIGALKANYHHAVNKLQHLLGINEERD